LGKDFLDIIKVANQLILIKRDYHGYWNICMELKSRGELSFSQSNRAEVEVRKILSIRNT
jgi:hypothetical protein